MTALPDKHYGRWTLQIRKATEEDGYQSIWKRSGEINVRQDKTYSLAYDLHDNFDKRTKLYI